MLAEDNITERRARLSPAKEALLEKRLRGETKLQDPAGGQKPALLGGRSMQTGDALFEIQPKGTLPPLFLVHGIAGGMLWGYANLSHHLGLDQPVYAFKSRALDGVKEFATIEEMAAHYIDALRRAQPEGPYRLGGYCFGGNVAFEMARQLHRQGQKISLLALFNASPPNCSFCRMRWTPIGIGRFLHNLYLWVIELRKWDPALQRQFMHWKWRKLVRVLRPKSSGSAAQDPDQVIDLWTFPNDQRRALAADHVQSLRRYQNGSYPGRMVLFRTRGYPIFCSFDHHYGWGEFGLGGVTVKVIPGGHDSILEEPYVQELARQMKICLEAADRDPQP